MKLELLKPHTHAGQDYPAGSILDTGTVRVDPDSIEWLIAIGAARKITEPQKRGK
jgi:hypothetical protein